MRVFVTGATGFIGSAVVRELLNNGHQVVGLARSDAAVASLTAVGAEPHRGALDDLESLRSGAANADGVIHTAFIHDFSNYQMAAATDRTAIETMGAELAGRPLVVASGAPGLVEGRVLTEDDAVPDQIGRFSEAAALELAANGVRASVIRLPPTVHGEGDHGFVPQLIAIARQKGMSAYPGDGTPRWAAVHRLDAAVLFRLALENAPAGARLQAIADEGVPVQDIAAVIGRHLELPVVALPAAEIANHFGWIGVFFAMDRTSTSTLTQQRMNWHPVQPDLIADLDQGHYFGK